MISNQLNLLKTCFLGVLLYVVPTSKAQHQSITNFAGTGVEASGAFVEGANALSTPIDLPVALTADNSGNIYYSVVGFGDGDVSGIYKVDGIDNTVWHVKDEVPGIAGIVYHNGGIYYTRGAAGIGADPTLSEYIYYLNLEDGSVTQIAGNGVNAGPPADGTVASGYPVGNPASVKIDPTGEFLYYSARYLGVDDVATVNFIQRIKISTNITEKVVGVGSGDGVTNVPDGTDAGLADIAAGFGMDWDSEGNFYFSTHDHQIKKIIDGKVYHVAGTGVSGYSGDGGNAADAQLNLSFSGFYITNDDKLIICDSENYRIRQFELSKSTAPDGIITTIAGTGFDEGDNPEGDLENNFYKSPTEANMHPYDIIEYGGNVYISDRNFRLRRLFICNNPEIASSAISKENICAGDQVKMSFDGSLNDASKWDWYKGGCQEGGSLGNEEALTVTVDESTSYYVIGTGGCTNQETCLEFKLEINCSAYFNAFTPNGDGVNEFLEVPVLANYPENTVIIYNRWGGILKTIQNYDNASQVWDGTNESGASMDSGTYFFTAESGGELIVSGWVELIK